MKVKYKKTGQVYDMPDNSQIDTTQFEPIGGGMTQTSPIASSQPSTGYTPITGHTIDEHAQAIEKAKARGDTTAVKNYTDAYDRELKNFQDFNSGAYKTEQQKAEDKALEKKNAPVELKGTPATDVNLLRGIVTSAQAATKGYDPKFSGLLDSLLGSGRITFNAKGAGKEAEFRQNVADVRTAIRNYLSGAAISPYEAKEINALIPKTTDSDTQIQAKLKGIQDISLRKIGNTLQTAGYDKTGEEYLKTETLPVSPQNSGANKQGDSSKGKNPIIDLLLGGAINIAEDAGAGITSRITEKSRNEANTKSFQTADELATMAQKEKNPQKRKELFMRANELLSGVSKSEGEVADSFSPDIDKNIALRSIGAGVEIVGLAGAPAALKSGGKILSKILTPFKSVGEYRAAKVAEAAGKTLKGNELIASLEKGASEVSPTVRSSYLRFLEQAKQMYKGKELTMDEAVKLNSAAGDAFTAAGKVGKAASAKFNKILGDFIKAELRLKAPDVAKANKLFHYLYGAKDVVKKAAPLAAVGGGAAAGGGFIINKLLGK